jgi:hypothetical protein
MEIEYRVYRRGRLLFRKSFDIATTREQHQFEEIASQAITAFRQHHPTIDLLDRDVFTEWRTPDHPLAY